MLKFQRQLSTLLLLVMISSASAYAGQCKEDDGFFGKVKHFFKSLFHISDDSCDSSDESASNAKTQQTPAPSTPSADAPSAPSAPASNPVTTVMSNDPLPATCAASGTQKVAVIIATFPGAKDVTADLDYVRSLFVGTADAPSPSIRDYYSTFSEGKVSLDFDFYGPYTMPQTFTWDRSRGPVSGSGLGIYEQAMLDATNGDVHLDQYDRLIFLSPNVLDSVTGQPLAMGAGLSSTDCDESFSDGRIRKKMANSWILSMSRYGAFDPSTIASPSLWAGWTDAERAAAIQKRKVLDMGSIIHEMGHSFSLGHANEIDKTAEVLPDENSPLVCLFYADNYEVMGSSVTAPLSIPHRATLGWLADGELQTVRADGTFRLVPSDTSDAGLKGLRIPRLKSADDQPTGDLWVEYRNGSSVYDNTGVAGMMPFDGAVIHYTDPKQKYASNDFHWPNETLLLQFPTSLAPKSGMPQNTVLRGSWQDQHSEVGIEVVNVTPQYMDVRVTFTPGSSN